MRQLPFPVESPRLMEILPKLVSPAVLIAGGLVALVVLAWRSGHRPSFAIAGATLFAYLALATPLGATGLVATLEDATSRPPRCEPMPAEAIVIVLAGGMKGGTRAATEVTALSDWSVHRVLGATKVAKEHPDAQFVLSGGHIRGPLAPGARESDLMRSLMVELGVGPERLTLERDSRNTWENATGSARLIAGRGWQARPAYLLTSAMHMPRALAAFRKAGIDACPISVDRRAEPLEFPGALVPNPGALANSLAALHEVIGMMGYLATGRI